MVTAGQKRQIFSGRTTLGESYVHSLAVPVQRPEMLSTPPGVVASHDELDPRKPLGEVAERASQVARGGGREALADQTGTEKVSTADVDADANERRIGPAGRHVGRQEVGGELDQLAAELERATKSASDRIGVPACTDMT